MALVSNSDDQFDRNQEHDFTKTPIVFDDATK